MADDSDVQEAWEITDRDSQDMIGWRGALSQNSAAQPTMAVSVKKNKKKKKQKGCDPEPAAVPEPEAVPELEAIPEAEAVPAEEPFPAEEHVTECETPPAAPEEPEAPIDVSESNTEKLQTPSEDGVGKDERSSQANDAPIPTYLAFNTQHKLMVFLQQKLEEMCFAFCQQHKPQTLLGYGWDCPESAELQTWVKTLRWELPVSLRPKERTAIIKSMSKIRDCAVNRIHIDHLQLEELLSDALKLAKALEQEQYVKKIQKLQEDTANIHRYLEEETKQIQKSFNFKLGEIAAARARLDDFEKATRTALDKTLLTRQNKARSMVLQSVQNAEALEHKVDPEDRSVTMSSLDLVNDLENSLMLEEDGGRLF